MKDAFRIANGDRKQFADRTILWTLLCLSLARGLFYVFAVPAWGHYDEPTHFEYAWLIAENLAVPERGTFDQEMRREVASSMLERRFFRDLPFRPGLWSQDQPTWIGITELNHPPFYYLLVAFPLYFIHHTDITTQLYTARLFSLLMYLFTIWIAYQLMGELAPPGHPLRWIVTGTLAFLPAYTDLMTSVNNDVGATFFFFLFLWGGVRTIVRGISPLHVMWIMTTAILCVWTKKTVFVAPFLIPVILFLAILHRRWKWWVWVCTALVGLFGVATVLSWGDAVAWYRQTGQVSPTSRAIADAPLGERGLGIEISASNSSGLLVQPLTQDDVQDLQGKTVTLGAWVWATTPLHIRSPMLSTDQETMWQSIDIDTVPTFHAITATFVPDVEYIQVILRPSLGRAQEQSTVVFYDGIVLADGARQGIPAFDDPEGRSGTWNGIGFENRVRNSSAETTGPRVRPLIDSTLQKYVRRWPSQFLASILDWPHTKWTYEVTTNRLFRSFWARFGWNQTGVSRGWYWVLGALTVLGAIGSLVGLIRAKKSGWSVRRMRALGLLALAGVVLWANAFLRPHPVLGRPYLPVARYVYPVVIPTVLALAGGWWTLTPRRFRRWLPLVLFSILVVLDIASLWTIWTFFYGR